jgi:murein DD-endopeptidase MepM/ murein hydrolase activator NlpD
MAVSLSFTALWPTWASDLTDKQSQLDQINQKIEQERQQLNQKEKQRQAVSQQLHQLDLQLDQTQNELADLNGNVTLLQTRIGVAQQDLQKAEADLADRTRIFDQRLNDIYTEGSVSYLDVLLQATSLSDFLTRFDLMQRIAENDISLMKQISALRDQIARNKKSMEDKKAQLVVLQGQTRAKQAELATRSQQKAELLSQIKAQKGVLQRDLDEDEAAAEQLTQIIQELQKKNAPRQGTGHLIWPVRGPITSPFGMRINPVTHHYSGHTGIDIGVDYGTPIKAADGGTVIYVGWNDAYGNMTVIDHGGGISTMYAHESAQLVSVGDKVYQGEIIGKVGSTGWSTGPHLHFEVRVNGDPVNPLNYLP